MVARDLRCWGKGEMLVKGLKILSYKMSKFWGSNVLHDDYNKQYCVVYLKFAKTVSLNWSYQKNKIVAVR